MASGFVKIAMDEFYSHNPNNLTGLVQRYWMMVEDDVAGKLIFCLGDFFLSTVRHSVWTLAILCNKKKKNCDWFNWYASTRRVCRLLKSNVFSIFHSFLFRCVVICAVRSECVHRYIKFTRLWARTGLKTYQTSVNSTVHSMHRTYTNTHAVR